MIGISDGGTLSRLLWEARRHGRRVRVGDQDRSRDEASAYDRDTAPAIDIA